VLLPKSYRKNHGKTVNFSHAKAGVNKIS